MLGYGTSSDGFLTFEIGIQIPMQTGAVPPHYGLGCDNEECLVPTGPAPANEQPEEPRTNRALDVDDGLSAQKAAGVRPDSQAADVSASRRGE